MTILGLDPTKPPEQQQCEFNKIIHANDADCFAGNTLVQTNNGLKEIKDVDYDDKVLASDGQYHPVKEIQEKHTRDLIVIHTGNDSIITTPMQTMFVFRGGEVKEVFAKDVLPTDMLLKRKDAERK